MSDQGIYDGSAKSDDVRLISEEIQDIHVGCIHESAFKASCIKPLHEQSRLRGTDSESEQIRATFREATFDGSSVVRRKEAQKLFMDSCAEWILGVIFLTLNLDLFVVRFADNIAELVSMLMLQKD